MSKRGRDIYETLWAVVLYFVFLCILGCSILFSYGHVLCGHVFYGYMCVLWLDVLYEHELLFYGILLLHMCIYAWLIGMCFISIYYMCLCLSISLIYACVEGELHLKSPPKIFVITIYVLSSSKRGRLLAQRPLARHFDDNKPYLVMFLTILFI